MKTLKQFKEDLQEVKFYIYRKVCFYVYPNLDDGKESLCYRDDSEFYEDEKFNDYQVKQVSVFHLENETCIDIMLK